MLEREFKYYLSHQDDLVKQFNGKYLVIVGDSVFGAFDSKMDAYNAAKEKHEVGTFLIQRCSPGSADYAQTFHSRVHF
jgi:hypothetical protein